MITLSITTFSYNTQHDYTQHNNIQHFDTRHFDIPHNDTQNKGLICDTMDDSTVSTAVLPSVVLLKVPYTKDASILVKSKPFSEILG